MARNKLIQAAMAASADDTEQRFYEALQRGDLEHMMACWAEDDEVACVTVDGIRVSGLIGVRQRFEVLLSQGGMDVRPVRVRRSSYGICVLHHVLEQVRILTPNGPEVGYVTTTNVYVNTPAGWRIVLHHASPGQATELDESSDSQFGSLLH